jgi:hypothetical protein
MIKKLTLHNFQLFKDEEIILDKINLISGINKDDLEFSSNGSGKSTIAKNAITFCMFGDVPNIKLVDLIHIDEKECSVEIEIHKGTDIIRIIRKIPTDLTIFLNDKEVVGNTIGVKQNFITDQFGDYNSFKKFRMVDLNGINILDLGIISLRKELMNFTDDLFTNIRKSLLNKKLERETYNQDKRLYKFSLSEKRLDILERELINLDELESNEKIEINKQRGVVNNLKSEIQTRERLTYNKNKELENAKKSGICPILKKECIEITKEISPEQQGKINAEIKLWEIEIKNFKETLINEQDYLSNMESGQLSGFAKKSKTETYIMKLKEAFKFKEYKYTAKDVELYNEAVKTIDCFAAHYINEWLLNLGVIINDLLKNMDLYVEFHIDKDFMKIKNGEKELKFEQLSGGQKCFLSAIFKIAILLHSGESAGIILCDEGLGSMDAVNFKKFIEICKNLTFQFNIIYHNCPDLEEINKIDIERINGISNVKS